MPKHTLPKAFYFFYFAALASLAPYLVLYYEDLGLVGRQIGILSAILPLVSLFATSFWGLIADITQKHQGLLRLSLLTAITLMLLFSRQSEFYWLAALMFLYALVFSPIGPLIDHVTLHQLGSASDQYGKIRLWGALGWGIFGPIAGRFIEVQGLRLAFYFYAGLMSLCFLLAFRLPVEQVSLGQQLLPSLGRFLKNRNCLLFLGLLLVSGIGSAATHTFLFLYLEELAASKFLMGLSLSMATVSEVAVFLVVDRLLKRWGPRKTLVFSMLILIVQLTAYSLIQLPGWVLFFQLLHGITFSAKWAAAVSYAHELAPPGLGATAQGLVSGVHFGLGSALGAYLGGLVYEFWGIAWMFRGAAIIVALGLWVYLLIDRDRTNI